MNSYEKLRESLKAIHRHIQAGVAGHTSIETTLLRVKDEINKALSVPPRNCDVGTAEEQNERYFKFCRAYKGCKGCPLEGIGHCGHIMLWMQMPYESESTTNKNQNKQEK